LSWAEVLRTLLEYCVISAEGETLLHEEQAGM